MRRLLPLLGCCLVGCGTTSPVHDTTPPDPPTRQKATAVPGHVTLTWRSASDSVQTVVARSIAPATSARPQGSLNSGDALGAAVVVAVTSGTSADDLQPPAGCGPLRYELWAKDEAGLWSVGPAAVQLDRGATSAAPPPVQAVAATQVSGLVTVTWQPPASPDFIQSVVVRSEGSPATTPTDGTLVSTGTGTSWSESLSGLTPGRATYYSVFACNGCERCSAASTAVFTRPADGDGGTDGGADGGTDGGVDGGSLTPVGFSATVSMNGLDVLLRWTNPSPTALTRVRVVRRLNAAPSGPNDLAADVVFDALASAASERVDRLLPSVAGSSRLYTYAAYGCDAVGCEPRGPSTTLSLTVQQALRGGGYTLFWRHAWADVCGDRTDLGPASTTSVPNWWKSCERNCGVATSRQNDTVNAPQQEAAVHTWFSTHGIPVGRIMTSEYCRAFSTAQGFNFGPALEYRQELTYFVYDEFNRCDRSLVLLSETPAPGTNTGMVSHAGFVCPTIDSLAWAEAAIFKPQPSGASCVAASCPTGESCVSGSCVKPLFIQRVPATEWANLP